MGSKTKKLHAVRKEKRKPNKENRKADVKRVQKNREILNELTAAEQS